MPKGIWTLVLIFKLQCLLSCEVLGLERWQGGEEDRGWEEWGMALGNRVQLEKVWWQSQGPQVEKFIG